MTLEEILNKKAEIEHELMEFRFRIKKSAVSMTQTDLERYAELKRELAEIEDEMYISR